MKNFKKGFTLIELLVVIAIVGILSGFVIVSMSSAINAAKDAKIKSDIGTITKAILVYAANNNTYPSGDTYPCTIGGGTTRCTTLESNLAQYLTAIPKTPSNGFYTYSYSGTGPTFTLQSTLSTGNIYQYNSSSYFSTLGYASTCVSGGGLTCTETTDVVGGLTYVVDKYTLSGATTGTTTWQTPIGVSQVEYLVIAGGGGGAYYCGGGGGGGGFRTGTGFSVAGDLTVTVGKGGSGSSTYTSGDNSIFSTITSSGGGRGGSNMQAGAAGGSGGGGGPNAALGAGNSGGYTPVEGYAGGTGTGGGPNWPGGGGGGAGGVGGTPTSSGPGGVGGIGRTSDIIIRNTFLQYAGGGGGYAVSNSGAGSYGGGAANPSHYAAGIAGTAGTGGGGGGGGDSAVGGNGGSGVVIIRYLHP
jgi:type II secretion system protein G